MKTLSIRAGLLIMLSILLQAGCAHLTGGKNNIDISAGSSESKTLIVEKTFADKTGMLKTSEVIFVFNSQACHCTLERCNSTRENIKSVLDDKKYQDSIKIIEIDYAIDPQKAEEIFEQYELWGIPSVVLKDKSGKILYSSSYEFNKIEFQEKIEFIINESVSGKGKQ